MNAFLLAIIISAAVFIGMQTVLPFPYGLALGIGISALIIWRAAKSSSQAAFLCLTIGASTQKPTRNSDKTKRPSGFSRKGFWKGRSQRENLTG